MERFRQLRSRLTSGPHGGVVAAALLLLGISCAALAVGALAPTVWRLGVAVAIVSMGTVQVAALVVLNRLRAKVNDAHYATSLDAGLERAKYDVPDFFADGAAGTPSLQLYSLKILLFCRPKAILELGSGQTTKLLSHYARQHPEVYVLTLEQSEAWADRVKDQIAHDYRYVPLAPKTFTCRGTGERVTTRWYADVPDLATRKFNYILVDGPDLGGLGTDYTAYSRGGVLEYMPSMLAESFVVMFDDAERAGEQMTIAAFKRILDASRVRYASFVIHGIKEQVIICSPDWAFLGSV